MKAASSAHPDRVLDLAPGHKSGLQLVSPLLAASGCWGFANEYSNLIDVNLLGALITNPISRHPRKPSRGKHVQSVANGVALHSGMPNPGISEALHKFGTKWSRMACPIIVHLTLDYAEEARECVERLEEVDNVLAIELGFRVDADTRTTAETIAAAAQGLLPVIVQSPFSRAAEFTALAEHSGAQAIAISSPPRVALTTNKGWFEGRLYSAGMFAHTLQVVRETVNTTKLPVIASGGVHNTAQTRELIRVGAKAVQLASIVWIDPSKVNLMLQSWQH